MDLKGKKLIFERHRKTYRARAPSESGRDGILQPLLIVITIILFIEDEGGEKEKKRVGHSEYHIHFTHRVYAKEGDGVYLWNVFIRDEFRKKGFGTLLLDFTTRSIDFVYNLPVTMIADPYGFICISKKKLVEWYEKFNFERITLDEPSLSKEAIEDIKKGLVYMNRPQFSVRIKKGEERNDLFQYHKLFKIKTGDTKEGRENIKEVYSHECKGEKMERFLSKKRHREERDLKIGKKKKKKFQKYFDVFPEDDTDTALEHVLTYLSRESNPNKESDMNHVKMAFVCFDDEEIKKRIKLFWENCKKQIQTTE